ncbi:MAG: TlpA disulfide reductase family protein [Bacteroidales bacterium]|nr:AhpC/TSA family protein [Bacteroidales bacterium]MDD4603369.1 TlpA disulfide reductase family protein [Bacteroidales bacterium]
MKKLSLFLIVGIILASCTGEKDRYVISGNIKGVDTGMIFLQKNNGDQPVKLDSAKLDKGEFTFKGKIESPEMWFVVMPLKQIFIPVFVENSRIKLQIYADSIDKSTITGSITHDLYKKYGSMQESINARMEQIYNEYKKAREMKDTLTMKRTDSISNQLDKELKKQLVEFAKANHGSVVSPYLVMRNSWQFDLPELEALVNAFDTTLQSSYYIKSLKKRIDILKSVEIGQIAPDFTLNDTLGKPIALSSLKGNVLLVDFWASWCGPCRVENPNVVKVYQAYHKKGFDILGCSFDQDRTKWLKAIKADNLTWIQVSDLKGWGNAAGKLYGINSIPANVLLDKDQKIIARNLRGEDLMKKLAEILGPVTPEKKNTRKK